MRVISKYWIIIVIVFFVVFIANPGIGFIALGTLFSALIIYALVIQQRIIKNGMEATGIIVAYQHDKEGHKIPVIEFRTLAGNIIKGSPFLSVSFDIISLLKKKEINKEIILWYDVTKPERFILPGQKTVSTAVAFVVILVGIIFIGIGVFSLIGRISL